jgi:hypothetical protein
MAARVGVRATMTSKGLIARGLGGIKVRTSHERGESMSQAQVDERRREVHGLTASADHSLTRPVSGDLFVCDLRHDPLAQAAGSAMLTGNVESAHARRRTRIAG